MPALVAQYGVRTSSIQNTTTCRRENSQEIEKTISEDNYRELFDNIPQSVLVVDRQTGRFLAVNEAAVELYGYSQEEFHALTMDEIQANEPETATPSKRRGHTGSAGRQRSHRKKDGAIIQVEVAVRRHVFRGTKAELVVCVDITERKRAEKRAAVFSRLGRRLSVARTPKEAAQTIVEAAETLFGWDACVLQLCSEDRRSCSAILAIDTVDGRHQEFPPRVPALLGPVARRVIERGACLELRPQPAGFPDSSRPFGDTDRPSASLMSVPVRKQTHTIGILSIQSYSPNAYTQVDLDELQALADHCGGALERIRAEDQIGRLNLELQDHLEKLQLGNSDLERRVSERTAQLEAINKELEAFSHSVSHDLRAPLRSVRGFSEVLLERYAAKLDATGVDFLRRTRNSCQDMDNLINDLLKLSRLSQSELRRQVVDLSTLAASIRDELMQEHPKRKVRWSIAPGLKAHGDERLLRLVLDNLLRNAWKFTAKRAEAKIEFGATTNPQPALYVRDNGAGFDMEYVGKLFRVFQRLHSAHDFPGTGVGLATVQRVINRHGGRVWAVGSLDQGATFYFSLPEDPNILPAPDQTRA